MVYIKKISTVIATLVSKILIGKQNNGKNHVVRCQRRHVAELPMTVASRPYGGACHAKNQGLKLTIDVKKDNGSTSRSSVVIQVKTKDSLMFAETFTNISKGYL
ncbi:hypothetical protein EVAR_86796_1 [Eumeta japonica]|uniref:Uncharacterized protein n=1 Tax=Eumeta variegata TaxID=151549 RepID=A0A4C1VRR7_EUMVA|nr:hypothetical protein EVAR_86796_1 [Eumeta japonica]